MFKSIAYIQWVTILSLTIHGLTIFIRLAYSFASQICEIPQNSPKIRPFSSSRSSKVIDNRKRICNFILVINSNFGRISYRFRDIDV